MSVNRLLKLWLNARLTVFLCENRTVFMSECLTRELNCTVLMSISTLLDSGAGPQTSELTEVNSFYTIGHTQVCL